jgi:Zn-dependent peptidase ImmA (M78 family)
VDISATVKRLIKYCGTDNPVRIARELGIQVMYQPLGGSKYGHYIRYKRVKVIIIDKDVVPPELFLFVFAHELGHAICTPNENTQWLDQYTLGINSSIVESKANEFAVKLLLNDGYLKEYPEIGIHTLAQNKGIPEKLVYLKTI